MRNPRPVQFKYSDPEQDREGRWAAVGLAVLVTVAFLVLAVWGNG